MDDRGALIEREEIQQPQDLFRVTLLRDEVLDAWDAWFRLAGLAPARLPGGPRFAHCELSLTAAERSQGVALAYDAMARATVAVLLVSADFLTSDFILDEEVPKLLKRRDQEGLLIFPILIKPCAWA